MMRPEPNALLVAQPLLRDPNFARTVVLLVAHDSGGSLGFVLNRPAPVRVQEVTDYFGNIDYPLFIGGPVQRNTLHIIHTLGEILPESQPVGKSLYWSGSWKHLRSLSGARPPTEYNSVLCGVCRLGSWPVRSRDCPQSLVGLPR